jgi:hypothetical protein
VVESHGKIIQRVQTSLTIKKESRGDGEESPSNENRFKINKIISIKFNKTTKLSKIKPKKETISIR